MDILQWGLACKYRFELVVQDVCFPMGSVTSSDVVWEINEKISTFSVRFLFTKDQHDFWGGLSVCGGVITDSM